ncbi:Hypothetical predicted protein [Marmota monax]|uniref:Uncharacterized protein n=1 Tax=Marmota monax TaxID=9995 RepID=A0A5E4A2X5_MARMO|nr:Hypothetical predicted protein [Marmota monax]
MAALPPGVAASTAPHSPFHLVGFCAGSLGFGPGERSFPDSEAPAEGGRHSASAAAPVGEAAWRESEEGGALSVQRTRILQRSWTSTVTGPQPAAPGLNSDSPGGPSVHTGGLGQESPGGRQLRESCISLLI